MLETRSKAQDSNFSLVSNKNLSEILPSSGWALGQITWAKMAINLPHLWCHPQKKQKPKKFFGLQTRRLTESFEGLNISIAQSIGELWSCKDLANTGK